MNKKVLGDYLFAFASIGFVIYNLQILFANTLIPLYISIGFAFLYVLAAIGSFLLSAKISGSVCSLSCIIWILIGIFKS